MLRLCVCRGVVLRAKTGMYVTVKNWNNAKGYVSIPKLHTPEQARLIKFQAQIDALKLRIIEECTTIDTSILTKAWLMQLISNLHQTQKKTTDVGELPIAPVTSADFEQIFITYVHTQIKTDNRASQFMCNLRMLQRYERLMGGTFKLGLDTVSDIDLASFQQFLSIEHTFFNKDGKCVKHKSVYKNYPKLRPPVQRGPNAVHGILKRLRTFWNWANKTGRTTNNPFKKFKLGDCVYGTPFFLTVEERKQLEDFKFATDHLNVQRDIFIFHSCIGCRVGDLYRMTSANIVDGEMLEYVAGKTINDTGATIRVPLVEAAKKIVEKYYDSERETLLPFISVQKYNDSIKEMLKIAGISRIVTVINPKTHKEEQRPIYEVASSHMARRNFIGNIYNKVKDPDLICSMTGHVPGSKAFSRYRTISDEVKKSVISAIE